MQGQPTPPSTMGGPIPGQPQHRPSQDGNVAGPEAHPVEGSGSGPMDSVHMGQPAQPHPVFTGQDGNFMNGAPPQGTFNGDGTFHMPNMMVPPPPPQQMMAGTSANGVTPEHAVNGTAISADEIALYDRQIRLWGIKAQRKIQGASVLLITMRALANEIAKNLVLAGIGSLTLVDDQNVSESDLGAQFFVSEDNIGENRAEAASREIQKLNPRVKVIADSGSIMEKGVSYFNAFDIVIATDLNPTTLAFINTATRLHNRQFYAAGTHGYYGYIFCDLIEHDFVLERDKGNVSAKVGEETRTRFITDVKTRKEGDKTIELVAKRELYSTWDLASETSALPAEYLESPRRLKAVTAVLSCLRALWAFEQVHNRTPGHNRQDLEFFTKTATQCHTMLSLPTDTLKSEVLRSFLQNIGSEIAPVTAVLGGQLAQDVINVLGQNQQPIQNMVIFDGNRMEANQYALHPVGPLGLAQLELAHPMMPGIMPPPMGDSQLGGAPPPPPPMGQPGGGAPPPQMVPMDQANMAPQGAA